MSLALSPPEARIEQVVAEHDLVRNTAPSRVSGVIRLARPRQWVKNLLVLVAPFAGGDLTRPHTFFVAMGCFGVFCLVASGTYAINDVVDAEADRVHPQKRFRPVASGLVSKTLAIGAGVLWIGLGFGVAWWLSGWRLLVVVGSYVLVTMLYSLWLKRQAVVELLVVAAGFVLRAAAGGIAAGIVLSNWFLLVTSFSALLIVSGKRSAEQDVLGSVRSAHRRTLDLYPPGFLRSTRLISLSCAMFAYCLWAFDRSVRLAHGQHPIWLELSVVPVCLAFLRVELQFQRGKGSQPEDLALGDYTLQAAAVAWVALFALGIYS